MSGKRIEKEAQAQATRNRERAWGALGIALYAVSSVRAWAELAELEPLKKACVRAYRVLDDAMLGMQGLR